MRSLAERFLHFCFPLKAHGYWLPSLQAQFFKSMSKGYIYIDSVSVGVLPWNTSGRTRRAFSLPQRSVRRSARSPDVATQGHLSTIPCCSRPPKIFTCPLSYVKCPYHCSSYFLLLCSYQGREQDSMIQTMDLEIELPKFEFWLWPLLAVGRYFTSVILIFHI